MQEPPFTTPSETDTQTRALRILSGISTINERFLEEVAALLKPFGISPLQYQVLRIIRKSGPEGLPSLAVKGHISHRVMDVTRLVDRLVAAGLVQRVRPPRDRRLVLVQLTDAGEALLEKLDQPYADLNVRMVEGLTGEALALLEKLLEKVS